MGGGGGLGGGGGRLGGGHENITLYRRNRTMAHAQV